MMTMTHIVEPITVRHEMAGHQCKLCPTVMWQSYHAYLYVELTFSGRGSWGSAAGPWYLLCAICQLEVTR